MSSYLDREVQGDEKVIYASHLHWIVYHFGVTSTIAGALLGHYGHRISIPLVGETFAGYFDLGITYLSLVVVVIGALHLVFGFIRQISTELVITSRRVIAKHGLISTTTFEVMLARVEGANIDQTILGRLLGYGTVMVKGTGGGISPIDHVANPYRFHAALMHTLEKLQNSEMGQKAFDVGKHD